jgi:hypothetical protein
VLERTYRASWLRGEGERGDTVRTRSIYLSVKDFHPLSVLEGSGKGPGMDGTGRGDVASFIRYVATA